MRHITSFNNNKIKLLNLLRDNTLVGDWTSCVPKFRTGKYTCKVNIEWTTGELWTVCRRSFHKFSFLSLTEGFLFFFLLFFTSRTHKVNTKIEMSLKAAVKAEVKHQFIQNKEYVEKKKTYQILNKNAVLAALKMQPVLGKLCKYYTYIWK